MSKASAIDLVMARHWAITPDALQNIARISMRQNEDWEVLAGKLGKPLNYTYKTTVRNGVAIIPINGPIFPKANMMTEMSGATSLQKVSHDLATALEDREITGIILDINSPGGVAFGNAEMAEEIRAASQIKPIIAYVSGMACSAAYWIAAGASEIVAHRSSILGSIGVVTAIPYQQEPDQNGDMYVEIVSSNAKNKRPDPRTDEGKSEIIRELDDLESQFIEGVSAFRGASREKVIKEFGGGGVLIAANAVRVGMADRLGSFEDVLSDLVNRPRSSTMKGTEMSNQASTGPAEPTIGPEIHIDGTAIRQEGHAAGFAEGQASERARILAIQEIAMPGHEALVNAAITDGKSTAADVALKMAQAEKKKGATWLNSMNTEAAQQPAIQASLDSPSHAANSPGPDAPIEQQAKAEWDKDPALRTEFNGDYGSYEAFRKAESSGRVRILSQKK